jgi:GPH family glycoside/pentoside/hexuronide:cation symporter
MVARLPFRRRFGYSVGDFGFNLFFTTASLYLLYYYTDVLGLPPATAGWIFAVALIWDAVSDPIMGYIASRTRSRWGRYRPYLLFGSIPLAASWVLMFVPTGLSGEPLVLFTLSAHVLFRTLYTVVSMPYLSLSAVMTTDSAERGALASYRMISAIVAGLFSAFTLLKFAEALGGGDPMRGFLLSSILFATLAAAILLFVYAFTEEAVQAAEAPRPTAREMVAMLRGNKPFWLIAGWLLMWSTASTLFGKTLPYQFKYGFDRPELIGTALAGITAFALLALPFWAMLMHRTSKRAVSLAGTAVGFLGYGLYWAAGDQLGGPVAVAIALLGIAGGAGAMTFWAMIPDTVEYGEWRAGVRAEGIIFGLISFVQKAALGLSVGLLGELLTAIGYTANQRQAADTLAHMHLLMSAGPMLLVTVGASFVFFYPLDRATHGRLVRVLARRARPAPDLSMEGSRP